MSLIARIAPTVWPVPLLALGGWAMAAGWSGLGLLVAAGAALPLARDPFGRLDRVWLVWPLMLAVTRAIGRPAAAADLAIAASLAIVGAALVRRTLAAARREPPGAEPEDVLRWAVAPLAWSLLARALAPAWPTWLGLAVGLAVLNQIELTPVRLPWSAWVRRHTISVAARYERLGCRRETGAWADPTFVLSLLLLLAPWVPLWLAAPWRARQRAWLDRQVDVWRQARLETALGWQTLWWRQAAGDWPELLPLLTQLHARAADCQADASLRLEFLMLAQSLALDFGLYEQAIAAGAQLASLAQTSHSTVRSEQLVNQAIGETALACALLGQADDARGWAALARPDAVLDTFLKPVLAVLTEPSEGRTDALLRAVASLPWSEQDPLSAPLLRWQRLSRIEQVRQRLDAGQDAAGVAQGLGLDDLPAATAPPDEVILRARLAAQQQAVAAARLYLTELLQRPGLPANAMAEAQRELARLG